MMTEKNCNIISIGMHECEKVLIRLSLTPLHLQELQETVNVNLTQQKSVQHIILILKQSMESRPGLEP